MWACATIAAAVDAVVEGLLRVLRPRRLEPGAGGLGRSARRSGSPARRRALPVQRREADTRVTKARTGQGPVRVLG